MTRQQAHQLLNAAQLGMPTRSTDILKALAVTGDLDVHETAEQPISEGYTYSRYLDERIEP